MSLLVHSARKLDADGAVDDFWLLTSGDRILATGTGPSWRAHLPQQRRSYTGLTDSPSVTSDIRAQSPSSPRHDDETIEVVDAAGAWLTPGFVELHVHGGGGSGFEGGHDAMVAGLAAHRRHGTTRSLVSLVANPPHALEASLDAVARLAEVDPLVLGAHLEGPFLAPARKGAHEERYLAHPEPHLVRDLITAGRGHLAQVTLAPELPDAAAAIEALTDAGVVVAVGHTEAGYDETRAAFDRGATLLTHAFNAMPGLHHRSPGPVAAAFDDPRVTLELIADGLHVHPSLVAAAFRAAPDRVALVTDAMAAACAGDGHYSLGALEVEVVEGRAVLVGTDTIAGSTLTQDAALRTAIAAGVDPLAAVAALTATPARVLGRWAELGALRPGMLADLVLLDPAFHPTAVVAAGIRRV